MADGGCTGGRRLGGHLPEGARPHAGTFPPTHTWPGCLCARLQDDSEWLVVDAGSVVAHVFLEGYRQASPGFRRLTWVL